MSELVRLYSRGGDDGETSLGDGDRVPKYALRVAAYGTVDETNAIIGMARLHTADDTDIDAMLRRIQNDLFDLRADLSVPDRFLPDPPPAPDPAPTTPPVPPLRVHDRQVERLEREIDRMTVDLKPPESFVLPGGKPVAAWLHFARTVARRAERLMVELAANEPLNPTALRYINRLSDHLFAVSRLLNDKGSADIQWVPGQTR